MRRENGKRKGGQINAGKILTDILNILVIGFILETAAFAGSLCAGYLMEGLDLEKAIAVIGSGSLKSYIIFFTCLLIALLIAGYIGKILWNIREKSITYFKLVVLLLYLFCCFFDQYEIIYMKLTIFITVLFVCILYQSNHYKKMIRELEQLNLVRDERQQRVEEMSKIRHDISNHLVAAGYGEDSGYREEIVRRIDDYLPVTGMAVVDTLLEYKKKACEEKHILFECNRCRLKDEKVELYDWVSIFGNILDNAIEACENVEGERFIKMKLFYHADFFCMEVKNTKSARDSSEKRKSLLPQGSRLAEMKYKDKRGLGLGIVKDIVSKYDGMFSTEESENIFEVHIMLNT